MAAVRPVARRSTLALVKTAFAATRITAWASWSARQAAGSFQRSVGLSRAISFSSLRRSTTSCSILPLREAARRFTCRYRAVSPRRRLNPQLPPRSPRKGTGSTSRPTRETTGRDSQSRARTVPSRPISKWIQRTLRSCTRASWAKASSRLQTGAPRGARSIRESRSRAAAPPPLGCPIPRQRRSTTWRSPSSRPIRPSCTPCSETARIPSATDPF